MITLEEYYKVGILRSELKTIDSYLTENNINTKVECLFLLLSNEQKKRVLDILVDMVNNIKESKLEDYKALIIEELENDQS